jgi:hypothetical protein
MDLSHRRLIEAMRRLRSDVYARLKATNAPWTTEAQRRQAGQLRVTELQGQGDAYASVIDLIDTLMRENGIAE